MIVGLGSDSFTIDIYDEDNHIRKSIYSKLEKVLLNFPKGQVKCIGKYKNGISMDFCGICAKMNSLQEVLVPYEDNDNSWPDPVKIKFKEILKKSKQIRLLATGGFNPKKIREMDLYINKTADLVIDIRMSNNQIHLSIARKNEHKIFESLIH
jgi:uncharacterized phage-like protein YoqJ